MRITTKILIGSLALGALVGVAGCNKDLVCGTGTIESDGVCISDQGTPGGNCGSGSFYDPGTGRCVTNFCNGGKCGLCDEATTSVQANDAGVPVCVGTGVGPSACGSELNCTNPDSGKFMICGRLVDTQTSTLVQEDDNLPNNVKISFYDALAFANDPTTMPQFSVAPDRCGRYRSLDDAGHNGVVVPGTSFLAVAVDDSDPTPFMMGQLALTGIGVAGSPGGKIAGVHTYATRQSTDDAWSGSMSPSFVEQGVYLGIFIDERAGQTGIYKGTLVPNITLTSDGSVLMAQDFYFDDVDPLIRSSVAASSVTKTGPNGAALFVNGPLVEYSGQPAPTGCTWPSTLAKTLPGAVFVQERILECN